MGKGGSCHSLATNYLDLRSSSIARLHEDSFETFSSYYFAASIQKSPVACWLIGNMLEDGFSIPVESFKEMDSSKFWFDRMVEMEDSSFADNPVTYNFSVFDTFSLAKLYEKKEQFNRNLEQKEADPHGNNQNFLDKARSLYQILQKKGYVRGFLEEGRIIENTHGPHSSPKCNTC